MNFFGIGIVNYFLTRFKLTTCKSFSSYRPSQSPALFTCLDVHFFLSPALRLLFIDDQMKSQVASKIFRIILKIFAKCL